MDAIDYSGLIIAATERAISSLTEAQSGLESDMFLLLKSRRCVTVLWCIHSIATSYKTMLTYAISHNLEVDLRLASEFSPGEIDEVVKFISGDFEEMELDGLHRIYERLDRCVTEDERRVLVAGRRDG